jgi:hypothetical protein
MKAASAVFLVLAAWVPVFGAGTPTLPEADRIRIAEAFRLAEALGNQVWPEWDKAPFAILLVTPEHEFLIRHPQPSDDFTLIGEDPVLKHKVWFRKRMFSTKLLATFPAVGQVPTIVVGQAENTEFNTSTRWVITLLHEHFHQLQNCQPRYFAGVDSLGLARGDQTGMWMLNYPFPYTETPVKDKFRVLCKLLGEALQARQEADFPAKLASYLQARAKFKEMLKPDDYKYLSLQLWQEGIARYTEYHFAKLASTRDEPSKNFQALKDYKPYKDVARDILTTIERALASAQLDKSKRLAFYPLGAAEGLLLDKANPQWRERYFRQMFSLDKCFASDPMPRP